MRGIPKGSALWLILAVGLLVIAWLYLVRPSLSPDVRGEARTNTSTDDVLPSAPVATVQGSAQRQVDSKSRWGRPLSLGDPLYGAASEEELAWLLRNGYPSMEQRQRVTQQLPTEGDLSGLVPGDAVGILISEQLLLRDPESGSAGRYLRDSAVEGSIYALEALARVGMKGGDDPDLATKAYYKAASMRGNWAVDVAGAGFVRDERSQMISALGAQQILNDLDSARTKLGRDPLVRDTRPGLTEFNRKIRQSKQGGS